MTSHRSRDFTSLSSRTRTSPVAASFRRRERSYSPSARYGARSSPTIGLTGRHSLSASNLTGYGVCSYPTVSYNKYLLTPLNLDFDPAIQAIRTKEKEDIKTLNNQFAALIGKVQSLEQHNQVLLARWNFLREQDNSLSDLDIKLLYDQYMNKLKQQIRSINVEKEQLDLELDEVLEVMDNFRSKYEDEINKRSAMEFTFTTLKKDLDNGFLHKTELEAKLNGLHAMAELMKTIHEQELAEALSQVTDISIVLGIDSNRINIDPHKIVEDVRAQYEAMALRSWEELEELTRSALNEGELQSTKYADQLLNNRRIIAELNIQVQKMRSCILSLKSQCLRLEEAIKDVGVQGEAALNDAKAKLTTLEEALQNLKQDLAHLVKEYQELMNVKLALDIEILTYRELMEGEEISMGSPAFAFISRIYSSPKFSSSNFGSPMTSDVTSRSREGSADRMSHSGSGLESGLSRNQGGGAGGVSGGDFSRSHSNESGGTPKALRYHSSTSRATLESSFSRSPSSRSGNFADVENSTESRTSRSHGSGSYSQPDAYRSHSSRSRENLEGGLSRSASRGTLEGSFSRSQSNRSGGLTDSVFTRTHSEASEGVSEGSFSGSHSGTSTSFVGGGLSRSQSGENEERARPKLVRTNTAEDGGVPVGGVLRSPSREGSEGRLSRSQSDKNESLSSREAEGYVEPNVSRTNSAEDGGVPVGGISTRLSETSRNKLEGNFSRSQSDGAGAQGSRRREGYVEPTVARTNSAEDGGVPVGGIPRSQSEVTRPSPERSLPRCHSGEDKAQSNHRKEAYAEPSVYSTGSVGDDGGLSRSHTEARRDLSEGGLSRSLRAQSEGTVDPALPRVYREGTQEGSDDNAASVGSGVSRSHNDGARGISVGSGFRTPSVTSTALTDSVFTATPCTADENVREEMLSRVPSGTTESVLKAGLSRSRSGDSEGPVETSTPVCYGSRHDVAMARGLSRGHSGESRSFRTDDFYRSSRESSRDISEAGLSRSSSKENDPVSEIKPPRSDSYRTAVPHPSVSGTSSSEAETPSGGLEAPVGSPGDGSETIPKRGPDGSYSPSRTLSSESASSGYAYLIHEARCDNLHHSPAMEARHYGEFRSKE